ncbi:molybdopterin-guanine dinucleotide biosynthesis protein B [Paenibacillus sp. PL2-23]|uniref:molybdopterin-guanine dinucleotide biosynthesis protein B n=1 Tax=Paenibacillus sp. PL2-23 TaxID=2100729 RepID=UPI0030FB8315
MRAKLIVQFVGYKNTGKTTWVCRMTELFKQAGYGVGTIKHDAHEFQMDTPGTDTWQHQAAGADMTAITSASRTAMLIHKPQPLDALIDAMADSVDVILVEGFKTAPYPKLVCAREASQLSLLETAAHPLALICWPALLEDSSSMKRLPSQLPVYPFDDYDAVFRLLRGMADAR